MRCPKCAYEQKYISGMRCQRCSYHYIFDPKRETFRDNKVKLLIDQISKENTVFFTKNQLYTAWLNKTKPGFKDVILTVFGFLFVCIFGYFAFTSASDNSAFFIIFSIIAMMFALVGVFKLFIKKGISAEEFNIAINRWRKQHAMPFLLRKPSLQNPPPKFAETDIYSYGAEGILVVDQDIYVDLFVKNNYHATWKVVVISQSGYPIYMKGKVQQIIDDNPEIKIYYLHDIASNFDTMKQQFRTHIKPTASTEEIDMGLSAVDVAKVKVFKYGGFESRAKVDHLVPSTIKYSMSTALAGGLLFGAVITAPDHNISDFG